MKMAILDGICRGDGRRVACCNVTLPCFSSLSRPLCSVFPVVIVVFSFAFYCHASEVFLDHLSSLSAAVVIVCHFKQVDLNQ